MRNFRGKKALVTGAASGIGRAIALDLAREGVDLYLVDIDQEGLAEVSATASSLGVEAVTARCDLTVTEEITAMTEALLERWGGLDILINNAGVAYYGPTNKMTAQQWDWLLAINLLAPIQLTRELLPVLLERPEAHIVNMCSMFAFVGSGRFLAYSVTKSALLALSESLRAEYARQGLGVTAMCPGFARTNLFNSAPCGHSSRQTPDPPRWISTTPARIARATIRAIRRDRRLVLITPAARLLYYTKRFTPGLLDRVYRLGRRRAMKKKARALAKRQENA